MKIFALVAMLLCSTGLATAEDAAPRPAKAIKAGRPMRIVPAQAARIKTAPSGAVRDQGSKAPRDAASSADHSAAPAVAGSATPSDCQVRLAKLATFKPIPLLTGAGECGAADAVLLDTIILPDEAKVEVSPPATLRCTLAEAIAAWVREDVAPAALKLGSPLRGLDNFDSYECRTRNRVPGATLSEHGRANALDVRGFKLANGTAIELTDVNVAKDWRDGIRASACARFSTVLGPGSDGYHEQHVHVDLAERRSGNKMCEWDVREPVKQADNVPLPPDSVPLPRPRPLAANLSEDAHPRSGKTRPQ